MWSHLSFNYEALFWTQNKLTPVCVCVTEEIPITNLHIELISRLYHSIDVDVASSCLRNGYQNHFGTAFPKDHLDNVNKKNATILLPLASSINGIIFQFRLYKQVCVRFLHTVSRYKKKSTVCRFIVITFTIPFFAGVRFFSWLSWWKSRDRSHFTVVFNVLDARSLC